MAFFFFFNDLKKLFKTDRKPSWFSAQSATYILLFFVFLIHSSIFLAKTMPRMTHNITCRSIYSIYLFLLKQM